jgi:Fe-S oxidoreductase
MALQCLSALEPAIARGVPIVGLEPSCILSLRDEWLVMQLGDKAQQLSKQAMLFEEWWMKEITQGGIQKADALKGQTLYVHGHCHQKALGAMSPTLEALKSLGADVKLIESSCCGMAGSFGYDTKHQTVSRAMAQASLVPAVNAAPEDALIVADGFSCQHQIADLSARKAQHAVLVIHQAVKSGRSRIGH